MAYSKDPTLSFMSRNDCQIRLNRADLGSHRGQMQLCVPEESVYLWFEFGERRAWLDQQRGDC